jgi:hypothetical protein
MNIGTMDGFDRESLTKYINDHSDLTSSDIIDIYLKDTFGFITIKKDKESSLRTITNINGRDAKFDASNNERPRKPSGFRGNNRFNRNSSGRNRFSNNRNKFGSSRSFKK